MLKHCGPILIWTQFLHFWGSWLILILQANGEMGLPLTGSDEVDRVSSCFLPFCQLLHANLASTAFYPHALQCSVCQVWRRWFLSFPLDRAHCNDQFACHMPVFMCRLTRFMSAARFLSSVLSLIIWLLTLPPFGVVSLSAYHHDVLFCGRNGFSRF